MTTGRRYHKAEPQSGDGKCGHSGRQLWDRCRALPTNVVICVLTEPVVDAKVKVHLLKNAGHCDTLGRLAGAQGVEVHHGVGSAEEDGHLHPVICQV